MAYPNVDAQPNFPEIESRIQAFWEADKTFPASIEARPAGSTPGSSDNEYVFYDGPPFANGLPHYGHLLTGYVKDAVPRHLIWFTVSLTMRGVRKIRSSVLSLERPVCLNR